MKPEELTIVIPYYFEDQKVLDRLVKSWEGYPEGIKFIMVDDCSPVPLKLEYPNLTIYRIDRDIAWNTPGACNLGFLMAGTPYVIYAMTDYTLDCEEIKKLFNTDIGNKIYTFKRTEDGTGNIDLFYLPMLLPRELYWKLGGMNEDFSGSYGFDDVFFFHKADFMGTEWEQLDVMWTVYRDTDDKIKDRAINAVKFDTKIEKRDLTNNILNFSFAKTYDNTER